MCAVRPENAVYTGENVILTLMNGEKLIGELQQFDTSKEQVSIITESDSDPVKVDLRDAKIMHLPDIRQWIRAEAPQDDEDGMTIPSEKQDFELIFNDGDTLEGDTLGFRSERNLLYLFPAQSSNQFIYSIVPHNAIKDYRIGPKIGEMLVKDNLVSEGQIGSILEEQNDKRAQPLGEFLRTKAVVTAMELERALEKQKSAPNLKLGEILISEKLISENQLDEALNQQQQDRSTPLGEILVNNGLVSKSDIQQSLAKKLGIPFVDLNTFQIDKDALALVPEDLVRKFNVIPLYTYEGKLVIALENPMAWDTLDAVRFHTNLYIEPVMAPIDDITRTIKNIYSSGGLETMSFDEIEDFSSDELDIDETLDDTAISDNVVVKLVNKIIIDAYHKGASDIHIEPYPGKNKTVVRIRKDGTLIPYYEVPPNLRNALIARIKIMSDLDISERRKPQDGKIDFKKYSPLKIELRVATIPTTAGQEDVVMRILASGEPIPLDKLGISDANYKALVNIVAKPYGLFFVCGPTGSGKTTTLHSILGHLNTPERKIWTAEDPVEITQRGLRQVQVQPKIGFDFAAAMRAFLRADPDVIMVGEMRDLETTSTGIEASLTGHLVFATLHTNSAPESIIRLLDMGMDPFNFADALLGVLAQRLAKRLCPDCKKEYKPAKSEIDDLIREYCHELEPAEGDTGPDLKSIHKQILEQWKEEFSDTKGSFRLYKATGCDECDNSGYRGRVGLHELLDATDDIKKNILEKAPVSDLLASALDAGMTTLKQDGILKVLQGLTDIHQIRKVCIK
jgi:type II secretory ATPase GspE/PulE/Tfp pilus assembly ATPase PilB-like protein